MDYSEEEIELIQEAFKVTRSQFESDLNIQNDEDVIKAIRLYHDKFNMPSRVDHLKVSIFEKNGLWNDGITTLEGHRKQEFERKYGLETELAKIGHNRLNKIDEFQKVLEQRRNEIIEIPERVRKELEIDANILLKEAEEKLNDFQRIKTNEMNRIVREFNELIEKETMKLQNEIIVQLGTLKNKKLQKLRIDIDESTKEFDEAFSAIMAETAPTFRENVLQDEINKINKNLSQVDLNELKLTELKSIADAKGLQYNSRVLKADLIEIIKNGE